MIDGPGDRQVLFERYTRNRTEQSVQLGGGSTVAVHTRVTLFETDAGRDAQRLVLGVFPAQITAQNEHALIVNPTAHLGLPLDVDHPRLTHERPGRDPGRFSKPVIAHREHRQTVDLPHDLTFGIHHDGAILDALLEPLL